MQYDKICLMIPTYKRVSRLQRLIDSALKLADDINNVRFSFCVNHKDIDTIDYLNTRYFPLGDGQYDIVTEKTKQPHLSRYFNLMYNHTIHNDPDTLVSMIGDDMVFKTKGWDKSILDTMNDSDGLGIVYCDDDFIAHDQCCVNMFVTRKLVEMTEMPFMCEFFHADMIDVVWTIIGQYTGLLRYLDNVIIKHEHDIGKSESDQDETFKRLVPIRKVANSGNNHEVARVIATIAAKNIILNSKGAVSWSN